MPPPSTPSQPLVVMKFGGTSVGTPERMRQLVDVVRSAAAGARLVIVVSALSGVTRELDAAYYRAVSGVEAQDIVVGLRERHRTQAAALMNAARQAGYDENLEGRLGALGEHLRAVREGRGGAAARDAILATGEQLTVAMVARALREAGVDADAGDATHLVRTDDRYGGAAVDLDTTTRQVRGWHDALAPEAVGVLAGFVGRTAGGAITTLGFEGSDYSAALFAVALGASELVRWTDVDGLYTADPRAHADAERIEELDLARAVTLNEAGRLGMHPKALRPLMEAGIPARIACIDTPDRPGTRIVPAG